MNQEGERSKGLQLEPSSGQGKASDYIDMDSPKLQALVYDILPSTTAVLVTP